MGGTPLGRSSKPRLQDLRDLTRGGKARERRFAEDLLAIDGDLETALAAGLELDAVEHGSPSVHQLRSQAHGLVEVVSRDAEFDRDPWFGVRHL